MSGTPFENGDTPFGRIYEPQRGIVQFATFCLAFVGGPAAGSILGSLLGVTSETGQVALCIPFVAIFFLGYALWIGRLNVLAFDLIGRGLFKALFCLIVLRRKPKDVSDIMPSRDKILETAVKAQKAGWSFFPASIPVAALSMLIAILVDADANAIERMVGVGGACASWGYALGWLGRHGYMPILEGE
jgi:hypothetical protein